MTQRTSVKQITEGATITFQTKNATDTVVWKGVLESVGTYRSIRAYGDCKAYNEAVRQTDPTVSSDVTDLTFFLITVDNDSEILTIRAFADEWIKPGTLNEVTLGNKVTVLIDDPINNPNQIVSILANAGYNCKIIT